MAQLVVEADFGNAVDVAQALGALKVRMVLQAARQGGNDLGLAQTQTARPAHRQDKGKAKARVVGGVERLNALKLFGRAVGQAGLALFVARLGCERLADHGFASQLGVGANEGELGVLSAFAHHLRQHQFQVHQAGKGPVRGSGARNPGGMLVGAVE